MGMILMMNIAPVFWSPTNERFVAYNDVSGVAVVHEGVEYTLNFDQQNSFIRLVNRALPVTEEKTTRPTKNLPFSQIIVFLFKKSPVLITPLAFEKDNLLFSAPEWSPNLLIDVSDGDLKTLLLNSYTSPL
jgi:hypothetical protein